MDEIKRTISQNFISFILILSIVIITIIYLVTNAVIENEKIESVKLLEECTKTCKNNVESFSIDSSGNPVCKCNLGTLKRLIDKFGD